MCAQGTSAYAWLFDNLGDSSGVCTNFGCNYTNTTNCGGYWTKTTFDKTDADVWYVTKRGILYNYGSANNVYMGIRPVVTIP